MSQKYQYENPAGNSFPLIASSLLPDWFKGMFSESSGQLENYIKKYRSAISTIVQSAKNCGFNTVAFDADIPLAKALLEICSEAEINVIQNPKALIESPAIAQRYINNFGPTKINGEENIYSSLFSAWQIMQYPNYIDWGNAFVETTNRDLIWNRLTVGLRIVRDLDSNHLSYFNTYIPNNTHIFEDYEPQDNIEPINRYWFGSCKSMEEYVRITDRLYDPPLRSIFINPFETVTEESQTEVMSNYFRILLYFMNLNKATGKPIWSHVIADSYKIFRKDGNTGEQIEIISSPIPTEGMIRFEAFTSLAFGIQGLICWQYGRKYAGTIGDYEVQYGSGLYNTVIMENVATGALQFRYLKSAQWNSVKTVNEEIQKYSEIFLNCVVKSIGFANFSNTDMSDLPVYPGKLGCVSTIKSTSGVLISQIDNNGKNYLVIVNCDSENENEVKFGIMNGYRGEIKTDTPPTPFVYNIPSDPLPNLPNMQTRLLPPGGYVIIEY